MSERLTLKHKLTNDVKESMQNQDSFWKNWLLQKVFEILTNNDGDKKIVGKLGAEFGEGLRKNSNYNKTQKIVEQSQMSAKVLSEIEGTPPVGLNLRLLLLRKQSVAILKNQLGSKPIDATIFGLAIVEGVPDFKRFLNSSINSDWKTLSVIDIDNKILKEVDSNNFERVKTLHQDARQTSLLDQSQSIVLRDHIDNCCPPAISRSINNEVKRVLAKNGVAIVNITTSDQLLKSPNRKIITHTELQKIVTPDVILALQTRIFDLNQLKKEFGQRLESLKGKIIEIEPNKDSFVVFGEDEFGHGEWFRSFDDHIKTWENDGLKISDMQNRIGTDSHDPKLICHRHIVLLTKKEKSHE